MPKKSTKKLLSGIIIVVLLFAGGYIAYRKLFGARVSLKDRNYVYVYIRQNDDFEDLLNELEETGVIEKHEGFQWLAEQMELPANLHPGKFRITNGMNMRQIVNLLKYNKQEKVKLSLNSQIHTLDEFVTYVDDKLALEAADLEDIITNEKLLQEQFGLDPENCFAMVVPGTIEVGWAISTEEFCALLENRYKAVWTPQRVAQARKLGYTPAEIITMASIVQSESSIESEQEKIAGVYFNRLKENMPLQADPTLKFANGNFDAERVLNVDKAINSPYNTYKFKGLPPGPICLVGQQAIDATLNYSKHKFLYFCAKPQLNGYSDFSVTYDQHQKYSDAYHRALDKKGINR